MAIGDTKRANLNAEWRNQKDRRLWFTILYIGHDNELKQILFAIDNSENDGRVLSEMSGFHWVCCCNPKSYKSFAIDLRAHHLVLVLLGLIGFD